MTTKVAFKDDSFNSAIIESSWKSEKKGLSKTAECQTSSDLYKFDDSETQTTISTDAETQIFKITDNDESKSSVLRIIGEFNEDQNDNAYPPDLKQFLRKLSPIVMRELDDNFASKAFDGYEIAANDLTEDILHWKTLSVDLEKKKVVYPDWTTAKHFPGVISKCNVTRNKERLYDIDYEDGGKLIGVREEHIRWLGVGDERNTKSNRKNTSSTSRSNEKKGDKNDSRGGLVARLQDGVRVHAKIVFKNGTEKFVPGRVIKVHRGETYDVECEGGRTEFNMTLEDLMIGLDEGNYVEARKPNKIQLQCTGISWNSTGSSLAVAYGRGDITGWCDFPGAVCTWNVFGKNFDPINPDFVLDHNSCIMSVKCHPLLPAVIAGGSFNGEIIVWDLTLSEQVLAVSPILEYGHKEPVLDLEWIYDPGHSEWLLSSIGADGKILFWSLTNNLKHPIRGALLTAVNGSSSSKSSKRQYKSHHVGTCLSFTGETGATSQPKWFVIGEQGGGVVRGQTSRTLGTGPRLTPESFKSFPAVEDIYPAVRRGDEAFAHEGHIGSVNSISCSPFARNIFLTAGSDGCVQLLHMFEKQPLKRWDPVPIPGTPGITGTFSSITGVAFSPIRPLIFAAGSAEGFLYLYDLSSPSSAPKVTLEIPVDLEKKEKRSGITGIAFNRRQRDLIAACDYSGKIHIWRLSWELSHGLPSEQETMKKMGSASLSDENYSG